MRQPTSALIPALVGFEARRTVVYADIAGIPTGGVGHTGHDLPPLGTSLTDAQIDAWLAEDIQDAISTIYRYVDASIIEALPDASYDALVSFVFNVGDQAFRDKKGKPTNFCRVLNARKYDEVDDRMRDWVYSGGKKVSGLINRRAAESAWWNRGFETNPLQVPVPIMPMDVHAELPEETGLVPDAPPKTPILPPKITAAVTTLAAGAASTAAPDALVSAGTHLRSLLPEFKFFTIVGAVLIAAGTILMLWHQVHQSKNSGA